jgi:hypothetical protein
MEFNVVICYSENRKKLRVVIYGVENQRKIYGICRTLNPIILFSLYKGSKSAVNDLAALFANK